MLSPVLMPADSTIASGAVWLEVPGAVSGSGLRPGDSLLVDPACTSVQVDGVYLLRLDAQLVVRRAEPCPRRGGLLLSAVKWDNPMGPPGKREHLPAPQLSRCETMGRVLRHCRSCGWP